MNMEVIAARYRPELALNYMFYDDLEDWILYFNNSISMCDVVVIACCRQFRMFSLLLYFLDCGFVCTEGKCGAVPQGLRELRT